MKEFTASVLAFLRVSSPIAAISCGTPDTKETRRWAAMGAKVSHLSFEPGQLRLGDSTC